MSIWQLSKEQIYKFALEQLTAGRTDEHYYKIKMAFEKSQQKNTPKRVGNNCLFDTYKCKGEYEGVTPLTSRQGDQQASRDQSSYTAGEVHLEVLGCPAQSQACYVHPHEAPTRPKDR